MHSAISDQIIRATTGIFCNMTVSPQLTDSVSANTMANLLDAKLRESIFLPDRSIGRTDIIALLQSGPDGATA
jgi:hypothetical protein